MRRHDLHELAVTLGLVLAASGTVLIGVMFWWPLVSYAVHYWLP